MTVSRTNSNNLMSLTSVGSTDPATTAESGDQGTSPAVSDELSSDPQHTDLSGATRRATGLGAETDRRSGVLGAITAHPPPPPLPPGAADIIWDDPAIKPPRGAVTQPRPEVLGPAVTAYNKAKEQGLVRNPMLTIIDYSLPSTQPRLWVIDMQRKELVAQHLVSHGRASSDPRNPAKSTSFSNTGESHKSSLGVLITGETYSGRHGRSLKLRGVEAGFNDHAEARAIVLHGADYATQATVDSQGYLGRSQGCPAMDPAIAQRVIDRIKNGSVLFCYGSDRTWLGRSEYLR